MKIYFFGCPDKQQVLYLKKSGFVFSKKNPDIIFVFGGDGSLMLSEQKYSGIPKVMIKKSKICKKCSSLSFEEIVNRVINNRFKIKKLAKIQVFLGKKSIVGINDVTVHNANPRHAIRYSIKIDEINFSKEIIGDGVVVSTPFGSSGYFRSITDSVFYVGMGLAFNNSTESTDHMIIEEDSQIRIKITRGPTQIYADNNPKSFSAKEDDELIIKKSEDVFNLIVCDH